MLSDLWRTCTCAGLPGRAGSPGTDPGSGTSPSSGPCSAPAAGTAPSGHSKGGNLALYGGANLSDKKLNRVKNIFTNDSPGFFPKVDSVDVKKLQKKWISIRPQDSIVGRIFELRAPNF